MYEIIVTQFFFPWTVSTLHIIRVWVCVYFFILRSNQSIRKIIRASRMLAFDCFTHTHTCAREKKEREKRERENAKQKWNKKVLLPRPLNRLVLWEMQSFSYTNLFFLFFFCSRACARVCRQCEWKMFEKISFVRFVVVVRIFCLETLHTLALVGCRSGVCRGDESFHFFFIFFSLGWMRMGNGRAVSMNVRLRSQCLSRFANGS